MKGKQSHTLPLTETMRVLLPDRIGLLFPSAGARSFSNLSRSSERLRKNSKVSDVTHHDLRRTRYTSSINVRSVATRGAAGVASHFEMPEVSCALCRRIIGGYRQRLSKRRREYGRARQPTQKSSAFGSALLLVSLWELLER